MSNFAFSINSNQNYEAYLFWPERRIFYDVRMELASGTVNGIFHAYLPVTDDSVARSFEVMNSRILEANYASETNTIDLSVTSTIQFLGSNPSTHSGMFFLALNHALTSSYFDYDFEYRGVLHRVPYESAITRHGLQYMERDLVEHTEVITRSSDIANSRRSAYRPDFRSS